MTNRRKFMIGVGSLAVGGAAAMGTGAMTSMSAARTVTVEVAADDSAQIALQANSNLNDISQNGDGELELDLTGSSGQGVNINSTYWWGDKEKAETQYAFKITNLDDQDYDLKLYHDFDTIPTGNDPSYIKYYVFDGDGHWASGSSEYEYSQAFPDGDNSSEGGDALTRGFGQGTDRAVNPGESVYVVIKIDTTGADASTGDSLTGDTVIEMEQHE